MSFDTFLKGKVDRYFEIIQLKNIINSLCVYEKHAEKKELDQVLKAERFFTRVLGEKRIDISKRIMKSDGIRVIAMAKLKRKNAYEENCEMVCILCNYSVISTRYTNLFGGACPHCKTENALFPVDILRGMKDDLKKVNYALSLERPTAGGVWKDISESEEENGDRVR